METALTSLCMFINNSLYFKDPIAQACVSCSNQDFTA